VIERIERLTAAAMTRTGPRCAKSTAVSPRRAPQLRPPLQSLRRRAAAGHRLGHLEGFVGAARAYSREAAYPEQPFPVTGSGAHCVLCQQPLGEEAARRLTSFEAFVQDESKRREQDAADTYDDADRAAIVSGLPEKGLPCSRP